MDKSARNQDTQSGRQLIGELDLVRAELFAAVNGIGNPLTELVTGRIRHSGPPCYAAMVLSAGYDDESAYQRSLVYLAAALEMLSIALGIHQLLVDASATKEGDESSEEDRSFIGSTILAGDFCFSHAADLAARTENPTIVALFSAALQNVSANRLKELLANQPGERPVPNRGCDVTLLYSGATAALELSGLDDAGRSIADQLASRISDQVAGAQFHSDESAELDKLIDGLPEGYQARWRALLAWLPTISNP